MEIDYEELATRLYADFVSSHGGKHPSANDIRAMIQEQEKIDVGEKMAMKLMLAAHRKYAMREAENYGWTDWSD
jgi:hypothetical protein